MSYGKLVICALSAVVLLSPSLSKSEDLGKTQLQPMSNVQTPTRPPIFQLRSLKNMSSPTLNQPAQCNQVGQSCSQDSDCCSGACDTLANGSKQCL
jgi:hypothetical protein